MRASSPMRLTTSAGGAWRPWPALQRHWTVGVLVALVTLACLLATYWAFLVPIYQAADEYQHLDYVFTLYSHGALLSIRDRPAASVADAAHPYSRYLTTATRAYTLVFHPEVRVPPGYGTPDYYRALDRAAPKVPDGWTPRQNPTYLTIYPFGYYALAALWLRLLHLFTSGLVALFFGARLLSVLLLAGSLVLSYAIARELGLPRWWALLLTGIVGFFPLTSFVASYVQPDNLSLALVSLALYLALRVRRAPGRNRLLPLLGLTLGALLVTKYHYALVVALPVVALLVSERGRLPRARRRWGLLALALALPSVLLGAVQVWVMWEPNFLGRYLVHSRIALAQAAPGAGSGSLLGTLGALGRGLASAFHDYYLGGQASTSYWGRFGWLDTPLVIGSPAVDQLVKRLVTGGTVVVFGLALCRFGQVASRLARLARRGRAGTAWRLTVANPVLNSHLLFTAFMFAIHLAAPDFGYQGRYWFPLLLPGFLTGSHYAPRVFRNRQRRVAVVATILAGLALYCALGSWWAILSLQHRYYGS